jgi:pyruvate/2-oxoglutarate dehydrogenase complex dihydrolipoamide acyltransferase (E2) component
MKVALLKKSNWTACAKQLPRRLTEAKQSVPHFYLRRDIELDALLKFRA